VRQSNRSSNRIFLHLDHLTPHTLHIASTDLPTVYPSLNPSPHAERDLSLLPLSLLAGKGGTQPQVARGIGVN
jgi:hypothetical protein